MMLIIQNVHRSSILISKIFILIGEERADITISRLCLLAEIQHVTVNSGGSHVDRDLGRINRIGDSL
jgi:hypothetical protein